jgi:hypothetical protein
MKKRERKEKPEVLAVDSTEAENLRGGGVDDRDAQSARDERFMELQGQFLGIEDLRGRGGRPMDNIGPMR